MRVLCIYFDLMYYQCEIIQYNSLNVKLSRLQFNKLKLGIKNGIEVTSNGICDSNIDTNFSHKLSLPERQVARFRKAFVNNSSANKIY